jgi:hypothetical protein
MTGLPAQLTFSRSRRPHPGGIDQPAQFRRLTALAWRSVWKLQQQPAPFMPVKASRVMVRKPGKPGITMKTGTVIAPATGNGYATHQLRELSRYRLDIAMGDLLS